MLTVLAAGTVAVFGAGLLFPIGTGTPDDATLKALADRCGSPIEWLRDQIGPDDGGAAFKYVDHPPEKPVEVAALLEQAKARAAQEQKLVLWHVYRLDGRHMYRAPILDDYMDQVLWSDPDLAALVSREFVPLRTKLPRELGEKVGLVAWDVVEPLLVFVAPDGTVVHTIDRIRTFDPHWFAEVFTRVLAKYPQYDHPDAPNAAKAAFSTSDAKELEEARGAYYGALTAYLKQDEPTALAAWGQLCSDHPDTPFAWRAAANLLTAPDKTWVGAARHGFEWPFETHLAAGELPKDTRWRRTPAESESVAENAVRWLLAAQRPDGSWNDCRYAYWDTPVITPNAWMAVTALAATALSDWRDLMPDEIDAALVRAEDYLFRSGRINVGKNEQSYADAYRILYLERTLGQTEDAESRAELLGRMKTMVDELVSIQQPSGQWAHEYDNAFVTSVALDTLKRAQELGVGVSEQALEKGLNGLAAARLPDGSYVYGGAARPQGAGQPVPAAPGGKAPDPEQLRQMADEQAKNASGRMPTCEAALVAFGRSDTKNLTKALANYQRFYDRFEKISKCDFHTDGELGGFFFFHDLYHATEAMKRLPAAEQPPLKKWFVEKITGLPEIDGSFLDDHEIGKSCSTAFALLALKNAQ